jgi:hypothetical protein
MTKVRELDEIDKDLKRIELGIKKLERDLKKLETLVVKESKDIKEIISLLKLYLELVDAK